MANSGPASSSFPVYQGDDFAAVVDVFDADNAPADLTGYVVLAQMRRGPADENPAVELSFTTAINGATITLSLTHDQTRAMSGRYFWDLELTNADGFVTTVLAGQVTVLLEVSRPMVTSRVSMEVVNARR